MKILSVLALFCAFFVLTMGIVALVRGGRLRLNQTFFLAIFFAFIWVFCYAFVYSLTDRPLLWFFFNVATIGGIYLNPAVILFLGMLYGKTAKQSFKVALPFFAYSTILTAAFFVGPVYAKDFVMTPLGNRLVLDVTSPWFYAFNLNYVIAVGIIVSLYWHSVRAQTKRVRKMTRVLGNFFLTAAAAQAVSSLLMPLWGLPPIGTGLFFSGILFSAGTLYVILKYRMIDLQSLDVQHEVVQNLPQPVLVFDPSLRVVKANPHAMNKIDFNFTISQSLLPEVLETSKPVQEFWNDVQEQRTSMKRIPVRFCGSPCFLDLIPVFDRFADLVGGLAILNEEDTVEAISLRFGLTQREKEVLSLLFRGNSNREIADTLCVGAETIKSHIKNILTKTGTGNRIELSKLLCG